MARQTKLRVWFEKALNVQQHEVPVLLSAFGAFFCVLASFFLLLPIREEAGVSLGTATLPWLFMSSLLVTAVAAPVTSAFVSRAGVARDVAVMQLLQFFSVSLLCLFIFYECTLTSSWLGTPPPAGRAQPTDTEATLRVLRDTGSQADPTPPTIPHLSKMERARLGDLQLTHIQRTFRAVFYCWINVMNLLAISALWARCADVFSAEAGARLFGAISAGGTSGQLTGSLLAGAYSAMMPADQAAGLVGFLIPISAIIMFIGSLLISNLKTPTQPDSAKPSGEVPKSSKEASSLEPGGKPAATSAFSRQVQALVEGFRMVASSQYLCLICGYILVHTVISSLLYFVRATVIATQLHGTASRTSFFAAVNSAAASILVVLQLFATGNILRWSGVPLSLFASPLAGLLGLLAILVHPHAATVGAVEVGRKVVQYTVTKPAREVLFTVVTRQEKYKAKLLIDTLVIRAGDALAAAAFKYMDSRLQVGSSTVVLLALACCSVWLILAYRLGHCYQGLALQPSRPTSK